MEDALPLPPLELRELVGLTDPAEFDNPSGAPRFDGFPLDAWDMYLDFGCGCGRSARRLIQQDPRPKRYVGVDLHKGMVQWCQRNLAPRAPGFEFLHHDVHSPSLNPNPLRPWVQDLPVEDGTCTTMEATSVFTHLVEGQAEFYLDEVARVLSPTGRLVATWFLFDKSVFPYMQDNQNALYINDRDVTNAVAYDRAWLQRGLSERGLVITNVQLPTIRGFHWHLEIGRVRSGVEPVLIPLDTSPLGRRPPPLLRSNAEIFGLDGIEYSPLPVARTRQPPPPINPLAVELDGAKRYIASLEDEVSRLTNVLRSVGKDQNAASETGDV